MKNYIIEFLEYLEIEKNRSRETIKNYHFYLERFFSWSKITDPTKITQEAVRKYRLYLNRLETNKGVALKKSTQNYHVIALRSFLKYLAKRDVKVLSPEKIELARMPDRQVSFLEGSDLERLLEQPLKTDESDLLQKRDKALLELLFSTGLRVSELAGLERDDVNIKKDEFSVRGKGGKVRVVFLSERARRYLKNYLDARRDVSQFLFIHHDRASKIRDQKDESKKDVGLTPRSIQRLIKKYARAAGITKTVTPHTMRHSYATDLLTSGADIRSVQAMLGHSSITTTQIYTHLTDQQLRNVYKRFHNKGEEKSGDTN